MGDILGGKPPTQTTEYPPPIMPALYPFAAGLGQVLPQLFGQALPTNPIQQPRFSPTMSHLLRMQQGRAISPAPAVMGQAAGALGGFTNPGMGGSNSGMMDASRSALLRFMSPQFQNPQQRLQMGAPSYFNPGG